MPLISNLDKNNAALVADAQRFSDALSVAAEAANRMAARILAMDDAQLTAWLQADDRTGEFTRHGIAGVAVNTASDAVAATLLECGIAQPRTMVDVRSVPEKLAAQGRVIDLATMTVTTPEPQPAE